MALARNSVYSARKYAVVSGGRTYTPPWRAAMAARTWAKIPFANAFTDVDPEKDASVNPNHPGSAPWHGAGGQHEVLDAWCSWVPSQSDGRLFTGPGGGHGDYAGNESYEADLLHPAPRFRRINKPSGALGMPSVPTYQDGQEITSVYSDGRIRATHNYANHIHIAGRGVFVACVSAPFYVPEYVAKKAFWVNTENGEHSVAADWTALGAEAVGHGDGTSCCYDTLRHVVWHCRNANMNKILKIDINTGVTTTHGTSDSWVGGDARLVYIPEHDLVANVTGIGNGLALWNPSTEQWRRNVTITGSRATGFVGIPASLGGGSWVPSLGAIAFWNNDSNTTAITLLKPPATNAFSGTWQWDVLNADAANAVTPPARQGGTGGAANVRGRFGYLPRLNILYLHTQASADMYAFALS